VSDDKNQFPPEKMDQTFGPNHRADLVFTDADGNSRAIELVITSASLDDVQAIDGVPTPMLTFSGKYLNKREPKDGELPDQSHLAPEIETVGFVYKMMVNDAEAASPGDDSAGREG